MKTFKTLLAGLVALGISAVATPAQAHDDHHWSHHHYSHHYSHGRVVVYGGYRPYYYDSYYYGPRYGYYRPYGYYNRPYGYYSGPSISFAFGGHRHW